MHWKCRKQLCRKCENVLSANRKWSMKCYCGAASCFTKWQGWRQTCSSIQGTVSKQRSRMTGHNNMAAERTQTSDHRDLFEPKWSSCACWTPAKPSPSWHFNRNRFKVIADSATTTNSFCTLPFLPDFHDTICIVQEMILTYWSEQKLLWVFTVACTSFICWH